MHRYNPQRFLLGSAEWPQGKRQAVGGVKFIDKQKLVAGGKGTERALVLQLLLLLVRLLGV